MITIQVHLAVLESIKRIVDMYLPEEAKHYEELYGDMIKDPMDDADVEGMNGHIYNDLELVNRFLHSQDLNAELYNQGVRK